MTCLQDKTLLGLFRKHCTATKKQRPPSSFPFKRLCKKKKIEILQTTRGNKINRNCRTRGEEACGFFALIHKLRFTKLFEQYILNNRLIKRSITELIN